MENTGITTKKNLYEILVPCIKDGKPIRTRYHKIWDKKVREISSGLTILKPVLGQWISNDGELYVERNIPVRIMCTEEEMNKIVEFTGYYYNQKAIMFYKISSEVYIREFKNANN